MNNLFKNTSSEIKEDASDIAQDFRVNIRVDTPEGARVKAAKEMGFREGLDMYKNPKPHDFRGVMVLNFL